MMPFSSSENQSQAVLATTYLGPVSYYCKLYAYPQILLEQHEHYLKQTYRNRCLIAAPGGVQTLTVPIVRSDASHSEIRDIEISQHGHWAHLHWQALVTAYEGTPYFEYYADDFRPFYEHPGKYLIDFNEALRAKICELLDLHPHVIRTEFYQPEYVVADFRQTIAPKNVEPDIHFHSQTYHQVFESKFGFLPDLSIVDLLFNMGPESLLLLRDSIQ